MDDQVDEPQAEAAPPQTSEQGDPPRPVRGLRWVVIPTLLGAAVGALWSAYYAAVQHFDPATPIWVGGATGLGIGAFLWVAFPYKNIPRTRHPDAKETPDD
ncbi:MAG TPA: hypothetical protein VMS17_17990 [Gemmataceae bacterium]|nr:hypothetical protein [Gemmataceae bacterium]